MPTDDRLADKITTARHRFRKCPVVLRHPVTGRTDSLPVPALAFYPPVRCNALPDIVAKGSNHVFVAAVVGSLANTDAGDQVGALKGRHELGGRRLRDLCSALNVHQAHSDVGSWAANRWGNVHLADLVAANTLALDKAPAGRTYNPAGGQATLRDIAGAIARLLGLNSASCSPHEACSVFGQRWVDVALSSNSRVCSSRALDELGWTPRGPELLDDLELGSYKRRWSHSGEIRTPKFIAAYGHAVFVQGVRHHVLRAVERVRQGPDWRAAAGAEWRPGR